jgi:hypothetical protein
MAEMVTSVQARSNRSRALSSCPPQPGKVREGAGVDVIAGTIARRAVGRLGGSDRGLDDTGDVDRDLSRSSTTSSSEPFKATIASAMAWLLYRAPIQLLIRRLARA